MKILRLPIVAILLVAILLPFNVIFAQNMNSTSNTLPYLHVNVKNVLRPPLQQFKSGISVFDVKCSVNYNLIIKAEDGIPACVTHEGMIYLMNQGWAINQLILSKDYQNQQINVIEDDVIYKYENGTFLQNIIIYTFINNFTQSSYPLQIQVLHDGIPYGTNVISSKDILSNGFYKYEFTIYPAIFGQYKIIATYGSKTGQMTFGNPIPP